MSPRGKTDGPSATINDEVGEEKPKRRSRNRTKVEVEGTGATEKKEVLSETVEQEKEDVGIKAESPEGTVEGEAQDKKTSERSRNRRGRGNRKQSLNFKDLQSKILPELHILAKEMDLKDYRKMDTDELVISILELSVEGEGLKLVKGYLEISSDGYLSLIHI